MTQAPSLLESALNPPRVDGMPSMHGVIKRVPGDFQVTEIAATKPDGEGTHLWLDIRREDMNTAFAARIVARAAGVRERDVGYAGLKDRHARTRQWFSIPAPDDCAALSAELCSAGLDVLGMARHGRKLRRGALTGNHFEVRVEVAQDFRAEIDSRLASMRRDGVPNYFGPQRFGHAGGNLQRARDMLFDGMRVRDRNRRGLYLSAARSGLFNAVLGARVAGGSWNLLLPGEAVNLAGSSSYFLADELDADTQRRLEAFDVHPSGPLWGKGGTPAHGQAREAELHALAEHDELMTAIENAGVDASRRALRLIVEALAARHEDGACVLSFDLAAGAYATVVLRELFQIEDASVPDSVS
jgi:tRNA pseudouridine13 synthase